MSDLTDIMRMIYASQPTGQEFYQGMKNSRAEKMDKLALEKAQQDFEAERGLRKLFAENPNPSMTQIGQYSPKMAMEMPMMNLDIAAKQAQIQQSQMGMQKEQQAIGVGNEQIIANTLGPIAEEALQSGDQEAYRRKVGMAMAELGKKGIKPPVNFSPEQHDPMFVLTNSVGRGYKSPWYDTYSQVMKARQMSEVPPRMSPEQAYGRVQTNPVTNAPEKVPGLMPPRQGPMSSQYGPAPESSQYEVMKSGQTLPTATGVTPEQKAAYAEQEAAGRKRGELATTLEQAATEKAETIGSVLKQDVDSLIDKSISSKVERAVKGADIGAAAIGKNTEAFQASEQLKVISAQLRAMSKDIIGAGPMSDKDQDLLREAAANIASDIPAEARKESYKTFMRLTKERLQKYPELAAKLGPSEIQSVKAAESSTGQLSPSKQALGAAFQSGQISAEEFKQKWEALGE